MLQEKCYLYCLGFADRSDAGQHVLQTVEDAAGGFSARPAQLRPCEIGQTDPKRRLPLSFYSHLQT